MSASAESGILLQGESLRVDYHGLVAIDIDSIEVKTGEVLALLGPNGSGKSTLVRVLAGLERPTHGRLTFRGREVTRDDAALRRATVAMLQHPVLWRGTVRQNIEYGLRVRGVGRAKRTRRVDEVLTQLGIDHLADAPAGAMSGGETKRVALARALAPDCELLFLDEPTADLDVAARRSLLRDLEGVVSTAAPAVMLITHDPGEAFTLADRVIVLEGGAIAQEGTPAEIFESPATEFVASFTGAEFLLRGTVADAGDGTVVIRLGSGHLVEAKGTGATGAEVAVAYRPEDVVLAPADSRSETSARNRYLARVLRLNPRSGLVRLRLDADGLELEAMITRQALVDLQLNVGSTVVAQMKATALHTFGRSGITGTHPDV